MAKTITVAGERLTELQARLLSVLYNAWPRRCLPESRATATYLVRRGMVIRSKDDYCTLTPHGKGVAAALAAYKEEAERG